jgi:chromosome segregation ATPase
MFFLILSGIFAAAALGIPLYFYFINFRQDAKQGEDIKTQKEILERLRGERESLQQELEKEKKARAEADAQARQQLAASQAEEAGKQEELQRIKRESEAISSQSAAKSLEIEKLSAVNQDLAKQLQERLERSASLENSHKEISDNLAAATARVQGQAQEIERLNALTAELNSKSGSVDASAQEELKQLKQLLEAKEEVVRKLEESQQALSRECAQLKTQLEAQREQPFTPAAPAQEGVPLEEYNKLKEKLESAEKVLRLIHGAG